MALLLALLPGCGGHPAIPDTPPANQGVEAYIAALRTDDPARAYALLSIEARAQTSFEDFAAAWKVSAAERRDQVAALEQGLRGGLDLYERTKMTYKDGTTVYLVREGKTWRLEMPLVSESHAGQPVDAARMFAEALARRDYEGVLRSLTTRRRESVSAQVESFTRSLLEHLRSSNINIELMGGDRAELRWDDGPRRYKIVLRKEGDEWRVDDVHLRPTPATGTSE